MSLDLITPITLLLAVWMVRASLATMLKLFLAAALLQSAAAIKFGTFGITPGHALLVIPFAHVLSRPRYRSRLLRLARFPTEGWWLLLVSLYSLASGYFLPRFFFLATEVSPIGTTMFDPSASFVPLGPSSGNFTQSAYMLGSFVVYLTIAALTRSASDLRRVLAALLVYVVLDICLALVDLASYWAGLGDALAIIHNGNYTLHLDEVDVGLKRIAGAFTEAAAFATATLGTFAFTLRLWVGGIRPRFLGALTLIQALLIVLSTSSTGYVGLAVVLATFFAYAAMRTTDRASPPGFVIFLVLVPLLLLTGGLALALNDHAWSSAMEVLDSVVLSKSSSDSAIDRQALNAQALVNVWETFGFGAGAGSVRASSFPLAVLANIGLPGAFCYAAFLMGIFFARSDVRSGTVERTIRSACRWGAFGVLVASTLSGALVDLGELFFVFAGCATTTRSARARAATTAKENLSAVPASVHA